MARVSSRQLYDNRDILTQILNLKDDLADQAIENIAFTRSGNTVTLTATFGDGSIKTASFTDNIITTITSSQIGDVVTLTFTFTDGTSKSVSFHVSGGGSAPEYYAGTGITKTGTASTGYTFEVDYSVTASKTSVDNAVTRITQAESDITAMGGRVTTLETNVGSLGARMATAESDIVALESEIGSSVVPGTIKYRLDQIENGLLTVDTTAFTQDNSHYPTSLLVDSKKLDKPTATPTVGQLLAAGASGPEWVNPTPGAVIDTGMSDTSTNAVQNKVIKAYVDDVDDRVDALEDEIGPETTAGTVRYRIAQIETAIGDDTATPKTGLYGRIDACQTKANLVTAFQSTSDDTHYCSEKLVYDKTQKTTSVGYTPGTESTVTLLSVVIYRRGNAICGYVNLESTTALNNVAIISGLPVEICEAGGLIKNTIGEYIYNVSNGSLCLTSFAAFTNSRIYFNYVAGD